MAESLLAVLSLAYLADRLTRAIGWSPLARTIRISNVDGASASLFAGMTGTVRCLEDNVMVLGPDRTACSEWTGWSHCASLPGTEVGRHSRCLSNQLPWL